MKCYEIREFLGDYALDIPIDDRSVQTIFFNSRRNAETVKRIMEVDDSISNAATVCDMVEVVRCKDCIKRNTANCAMWFNCIKCGGQWSWESDNGFCNFGEMKEQT